MSWFRKEKRPKAPVEQKRLKVPEGLWAKCDGCSQIIYKKEIARNANVCPKCGYHFRISARERLGALYDGGLYEEFNAGLISVDPLNFKDSKPYRKRLDDAREATGGNEAVLDTHGMMGGIPVTDVGKLASGGRIILSGRTTCSSTKSCLTRSSSGSTR